jgi:hypothetical protein
MEENNVNQGSVQTQEQTNEAGTTTAKNTENFEEKFDEILNKRMDKIAKSILKDNGMQDEEITNFIKSYHTKKEENSRKVTDEMERIKKENESLKSSIFKSELEHNIKGLSGKLGFDEKYTNQITKLADLSEVKNVDGKINAEKLEEAINKVLEDCEAFKVTKQNETNNKNGFTTVGAGQNETEENSLLQRVAAAMNGH